MKMTFEKSLASTVFSLLMPCVLLGLQSGCTTHPPTAAKLHRLQGTWEGGEGDGKITITITGNSLHFHRDTNFWFETTITLPAGKDPKQFHATIKDCPPSQASSMGKVVGAIFKIEDGTLTIVASGSLEEMPKSFEASETQGLSRFELRKVQPKKKNAELTKSKVTMGETGQPQQLTGNARALESGRRHPSEIAKIVSRPDLVPVPIVFQNNSAGTYLTHPWVITDAHGNALALYYPDGQKRTVTLE